MAQKYKRRIRNLFLKKNLQGKIILAVFLAATLSCIFFIIVFGFFSADTMTIAYSNNDLQMGNTPMMLLKKALTANLLFLVVCGTLLVIVSLIGTHRIAGPLYRFEKTLDSMIGKELDDTIRLRGKDEGKELAGKINQFNLALSKDFRELHRRSKAINDLLNHYESLNTAHLSPDEIESICNALRTNNDKIRNLLANYQLANE